MDQTAIELPEASYPKRAELRCYLRWAILRLVHEEAREEGRTITKQVERIFTERYEKKLKK